MNQSWLFWTFLIVFCAASSQFLQTQGIELAKKEQLTALNDFFGSVDRDGDGQIQPSEALSYIGANFDEAEIAGDRQQAAGWVYETLEGNDADATISKAEVEKHLKQLLKGNRVSEWLKHSAQMPQYVQAFRDNQVTSLDFPVLVADGGHILDNELGVKSKLHREQLIRAFKRVILGIGTTPSPPQELKCQALSCHEIALTWGPPQQTGHPPMHKYKLERMLAVQTSKEAPGAPVWITANPDLDDEDCSWLDLGLEAGEYMYRLTAWNFVGWSEYAFSPICNTTEPSLPCESWHCLEASCPGKTAPPPAPIRNVRQLQTVWSMKHMQTIAAACIVGAACIFTSAALLRRLAPFGHAVNKGGSVDHLHEAHATATFSSMPEADLKAGALKTGSLSSSLEKVSCPTSPISKPYEPQVEIEPDVRMKALRNTTKRRSSTRLAEADCFVPGQLDSLRPLSSMQRPVGTWDHHGEQDTSSIMSQGNVIWLDDQGQQTAAPAGLEMVLTPEGGDRHKCAFPGCQKSLRVIFSPKAAMTSHYCSRCQNVFCHHHTKYSPHGMLGNCGLESKCICQICHDDLPRAVQERLEKTNRIHRSSKKEDSGRGLKVDRSKRTLAEKPGSTSGGSSNSLQAMARSGEEHWAKLRTAWKAVKRFQGAGDERRRRTSEAGVAE